MWVDGIFVRIALIKGSSAYELETISPFENGYTGILSYFVYNGTNIQTITSGVIHMASTVVQVRMDESLRADASSVAEQLGLDLPTAIRVFLKKMVAERAVPFPLSLPRERGTAEDGLSAMYELGRRAAAAGVADMTLEEIDAEISDVRSERATRRA